MEYTKLMSVLSETDKYNQSIIIYFEDGFVFKSAKNTGVFESCNCLEMDDEQYLEYYACGLEITEILELPKTNNYDANELQIGKLIEISDLNKPIKIETEDKEVIWECYS